MVKPTATKEALAGFVTVAVITPVEQITTGGCNETNIELCKAHIDDAWSNPLPELPYVFFSWVVFFVLSFQYFVYVCYVFAAVCWRAFVD